MNPAGFANQAVEIRGNGTAAADIREYQWALNHPTWDNKATPTSGDLATIDKDGNLRTYAGDQVGDTDAWIPSAVENGKPVAPGYWKDPATGKPALIGHATDWHPGDGITDSSPACPTASSTSTPAPGPASSTWAAARRCRCRPAPPTR